jgi:tetratricopeptide (TPR) repeat protein
MAAEDIQALINNGKYKEAREALDRMEDGDRKYFLKGIVALREKNYDLAQELFSRAIEISKKPEYFRMRGISHMEILEVEKAAENFVQTIKMDKNDIMAHFFLSVSYLFMDDPRAEEHMRNARDIDEKKTKQLLRNFYTIFIKEDPAVTDAQKKKMHETINTLWSKQ